MSERRENIFISWSGKRSLYIAKTLRDWLPNVIQAAVPFFSDEDIEKGTRGLTEVSKALEGMKIGIVCLTPENLNETWVNFEAGALSKMFSDDKARLCTYLLDVKPQQVKPPLGMFQWTRSEDKEDTRKLLYTINRAISEVPLSKDRLDGIFDTFWPQLETKLKQTPAPEKIVDVSRGPDEIMNEILSLCRNYLPQVAMVRNRVFPSQPLQVAPPPPIPPVSHSAAWKPWEQTIWVKRKGIEDLEYVDGRTYEVTPEPGVLVIYRGPDVLKEFHDVEDWGFWGENNGAEVKAKYKVDPKLG